MGFLDDLKRQADEAKARQTTDIGALERNAALADSAAKTASTYITSLVQQLNVLKPVSKVSYRLDNRNAFDALPMSDFRADVRRKRVRGADVFDHVSLRWRLKSGKKLTLAKNFLPEIERLESRLRRGGAQFHAATVRNPENNKLQEMRYEFIADFEAAVTVTPDHDTGRVRFELVNLGGFETINVDFAAFEVGNARLDELARFILGEPNAFLKGGQGVRLVEA